MRLYLLTLVSVLISLSIFLNSDTWNACSSNSAFSLPDIKNDSSTHFHFNKNELRKNDQTFLTFPEWYLVYSPEEQAQFFKNASASEFPYINHTIQFWKSYSIVSKHLNTKYEYNSEYHTMIWVIGVSTTIEYLAKALYELYIGTLSSILSFGRSEDDNFNQAYYSDYVSFIKVYPWYEYDYYTKLKNYYTQSNPFSTHILRNIERRYWYTSEFLIKGIYGGLIKKASQSAYGIAGNTTMCIIQCDSSTAQSLNATVKKTINATNYLVEYPRYDAFSKQVEKDIHKDFYFKSVAGNSNYITLSVLCLEKELSNFKKEEVIFTQEVVCFPGVKRAYLLLPLDKLTPTMHELLHKGLIIEHIYDF